MWKYTTLALAALAVSCSKPVAPAPTPVQQEPVVNSPAVLVVTPAGTVPVAPVLVEAKKASPVKSAVRTSTRHGSAVVKTKRTSDRKEFDELLANTQAEVAEFRAACLRGSVERKVEVENFYQKGIMDWGNVREAPICAKAENEFLHSKDGIEQIYKQWHADRVAMKKAKVKVVKGSVTPHAAKTGKKQRSK